MSFESFYQAGAGLFGAYGKGQEEFRQRNALAQLGTQLQGGDYNGAAQTAFAAGDAQTGIGLLKLGEAQRQSKLEEANVATFFGGGSGALAALGADQSSGLSPLGAPSRSLPSFADTSGPAGGYLAGLEKRESGGNALARNSSSSATGLHQFTDRTWAGVMREHPELGLTPNGRTDPEQSRRAVVAFTADNERVLQRAGLPVNDASRYASHFLGRSGGPRFVAGALNNPDAPASAYANPDQVRANRTIFYNRDGSPKTAGQVMADFGRSFGGVQRPAGAPSRAGVAVANNEAETQALEARMGMVPPVRRPVAFASNEAETQVLEARMGMTPQVPQQVASYDPRADMPAQGAIPMGFSIPEGQGAVGDEQPAGPRRAVASSSSIFNGDAARIANPSFGAPAMGAPPPGRTMSLPQEAGGPPAQVAQAGGGLPAGVAPQQAPAGGDMGLMARLSRMSPNERVDYLTRLSAVRLPERFQGIIKSQLDAALQEARDPEGVREFVWARRNGMTQARSPAEYAREQKGPQGYAPGTSILTPDGQSVAFTVPDRNRSNVADDIDARRQAAAGLGLREGTPQFQSYVLTGKMPREDQQAPSPSDRKAILEADETVESANAAITNLKAAKELSAKAYAGPLAGWRGWAMGALGSETGQATQELDNLVTTNALSQLKAIFGAAPTEGERKILLDIQGSSSLPHALRIKIYDRAEKAIERRRQIFQERADGIRGGTYFRPDGGPQGSRGASSTGGAPALPAPAPSNRPGAASAGDRFGALVGSGMSREQAFEQMAQEGY